MQEEKTVENKANYIDGGNFKTKIGNTTYLVGVFFNNAKKVTVEDRMKNLICQEVVPVISNEFVIKIIIF